MAWYTEMIGTLRDVLDRLGSVDFDEEAEIDVGNFPESQTIDGEIDVGNFPESQTIDGEVATRPVTVFATEFESIIVDNTVLLNFWGAGVVGAKITVEDEPIRYMMHPYNSEVLLTSDELDVLNAERYNGVDFDDNFFVKVTSDPGNNEWVNATDLVNLIQDLANWDAFEPTAGNVEIISAETGRAWEGQVASLVADVVDAAGADGETTPASCVLSAEMFAQTENGDIVEFYSEMFTKADATDVPNNEWTDAVGLANCIDGIEGWTASESAGDVIITADDYNTEKNGESVVITHYREVGPETPNEGHIAEAGHMARLESEDDVANFRATNQGASEATIRVTYFQMEE